MTDPAIVGVTGSQKALDPGFAAYHAWHMDVPVKSWSKRLFSRARNAHLLCRSRWLDEGLRRLCGRAGADDPKM